MAERIPPGRAGRLWLRNRLAAAERSRDLLDRKRRLLRRRRQVLEERCSQTGSAWTEACEVAERWAQRTAVLGGATELDLLGRGCAGRGRIEVAWSTTMGVRQPDTVRCRLPEPPPLELAAANGAAGPAAAAQRRAVEAAAEHAAARRALQAVDGELRGTQQRLRAIERRRLPVLSEALHRLELSLDEIERQEQVVGRWAGSRRRPDGPPQDRAELQEGLSSQKRRERSGPSDPGAA